MVRPELASSASATRRETARGDSAENRLLERVARGDRQALAELYARFQRPLFSYLYHLLGQQGPAEDTLQEVMVIVWQRAHTFRGNSQATSWIFAARARTSGRMSER